MLTAKEHESLRVGDAIELLNDDPDICTTYGGFHKMGEWKAYTIVEIEPDYICGRAAGSKGMVTDGENDLWLHIYPESPKLRLPKK